jgi:hypothetical protein
MGDFYRLSDNRGFVKMSVQDHVAWERLDPYKGGANKNIDFLERLLLFELGSLSAWSAYCLLCSILQNLSVFSLESDVSGRFVDSWSPGLLQLLLSTSGIGKCAMSPGGRVMTKSSYGKELVAKRTPLSITLHGLLTDYYNKHDASASLGFMETAESLPAKLISLATYHFTQCRQQFVATKASAVKTESSPTSNRPQFVVLESAHEYENNTDVVMRIHLPGANAIEIVFDEETSTEVYGCCILLRELLFIGRLFSEKLRLCRILRREGATNNACGQV